MLQTRLLRTSTFRYAILYMAVFGLSVCGLLGFVYWTTVGVIEAQTDATIEAEIAGLEERYRARGLFGLVEVIRARSTDDIRQRGIYLLFDFHPYLGYASSQRQLRDILQRRHTLPHVVVLVGAKIELPAELEALAQKVDLAARAALRAVGYHQHKRGEWRKRRGPERPEE